MLPNKGIKIRSSGNVMRYLSDAVHAQCPPSPEAALLNTNVAAKKSAETTAIKIAIKGLL
jgi:hypothetical protein